MSRKKSHLYLRAYVAVRYPECRLDFIGPDMAMITSPEGDRWLIRDRKPADWWTQLAYRLVPATIYTGAGMLVVMLMAQIAS